MFTRKPEYVFIEVQLSTDDGCSQRMLSRKWKTTVHKLDETLREMDQFIKETEEV